MAVLRNKFTKRIFHVPGEMMRSYIESMDMERIQYVEVGKGPPGRVSVFRTTGGLGDVIAAQAVVAGFQAQGKHVTLWTPEVYWPVSVADATMPGVGFDPVKALHSAAEIIQLYCPAADHEAFSGMRPTAGRVRNFCEAAGVEPTCPPLWRLVDRVRPARDRPRIGVQLISAHPAKDLPPEHAAKLVEALRGYGEVHAFHDKRLPWEADVNHIGRPLREVMELVAGMDAMVCVDSGLLHLAGALDVPTVGLFGPTNGPITCEFYPSVSIFQGADRAGIEGEECFTPCYYSKVTNGFACRGKTGPCMRGLNVSAIAVETAQRAHGGPPRHFVPEQWLRLNPEMENLI